MTKIFLSHSSKDKVDFINPVYKRLCSKFGEQRIIIDQFSFEEGRKTAEEIEKYIEQSDLIVLFISDDSLESEWIQKEYSFAKKMIEQRDSQICPIIIDDEIFYNDSRIPDWLKESYNIQKIRSTRKASDIISSRMYEILAEKNPKSAMLNNIFVGRNELLNEVEERLDSFGKPIPRVLIASGFPGVGRKTFLTKSLIKSNVVRESFLFPEISINYTESIEDFILKLVDLGFTDSFDIKKLSNMDLVAKKEILVLIVKKLQENKEIVIVRDCGCIINHEGEMSRWFYDMISSVDLQNTVTFLIASKFKYLKNKSFEPCYFDISIYELSAKERAGLLNRMLSIEEIDLKTEDKESISKILTGFPKQVQYAVQMIKELGIDRFNREKEQIIDFGNKNAAVLFNEVSKSKDELDLLILLSKFDYMDKEFVGSIFEKKDFNKIIDKFYLYGICDYLGISQEYIRLSDVVKDYIIRGKFKLPEIYIKKIKEVSFDIIKNHNYQDDVSVPKLLFTIRQSLINGENIDENFLIPSLFLSTMNDLYHSKKYAEVIKFADKALENENKMDNNIIFELRYLLCLSLAQLRMSRFTEEVQKINGPDHSFLFGFYYRKIGRFAQALNMYNKSIAERPTFSKAKREKVQVLIGMQDYESAIELAKLNYENYSDNPYHIQAYFSCLIKRDDSLRFREELEKLIYDIDLIRNKVAEEMALRMKAKFEAFINHNKERSLELINSAIEIDENLPYARIVKFDIGEKFHDLSIMKEILNYFEGSGLKTSYYFSNICYMQSIIILYEEKNLDKAKNHFSTNVRNYTDNALQQVLNKFERINNFLIP